MNPESGELVEHLERFLGEIEMGWRVPTLPNRQVIQVVRFSRTAFGGTAFATLGLSRQALRSRVSDRTIHQELLMIVSAPADRKVPAVLAQLASEVSMSEDAILRGDVIGPRGALFDDSAMEALYATVPVYLPDEFGVLDRGSRPVVVSWLVPILHAEAHYVVAEGWPNFERLLVEADPDLVDVCRLPVVPDR
jgi:hypothetical protein